MCVYVHVFMHVYTYVCVCVCKGNLVMAQSFQLFYFTVVKSFLSVASIVWGILIYLFNSSLPFLSEHVLTRAGGLFQQRCLLSQGRPAICGAEARVQMKTKPSPQFPLGP